MKVPLSTLHLVFISFHLKKMINHQTESNCCSQLSDHHRNNRVSRTFPPSYFSAFSHQSSIKRAQVPAIRTGNRLGDFKQQQQRKVCCEEPQAYSSLKRAGETHTHTAKLHYNSIQNFFLPCDLRRENQFSSQSTIFSYQISLQWAFQK